MPPTTRTIPPDRRAPWVAFVLALVVRAVVHLELSGSPLLDVLVGDAAAYEALAARFAAEGLAPLGESYQAPLYPLLLAGVRALLGPELLWVRVVQALVGALGAALVTAATGRLFSRGAAWTAAVASACYAPWIWTDLLVQKTSFALLAAAAWTWIVAQEATWWRALAAGVVLGLWTAFRENALLVGLAFLPWIEERRGHAAGRWPGLAASAAGVALVLVPWVAAFRAAGGEGPWPTSNAGVNFYVGNGALATGAYVPLVVGRGSARFEAEDARRLAEESTGRELTPAGVSRHWFERGLREALDDPAHTAWTLAHKARFATAPAEPMDADAFEAWAEESHVLRSLFWPFSFSTLLVFGVLGGLAAGDSRRSALPHMVGIASLVLGLLVFFVAGRFRMSLVPLALPFAAHGVVVFVQHFVEGGGRAKVLLAALVPVAVLVLPRDEPGDPRAVNWSNLASRSLVDGDDAAALRHATRALAFDPHDAAAHFNAGLAHARLGQDREALAAFESAARNEPAFAAEALLHAGVLQARLGDREKAIRVLSATLTLVPGNHEARLHLATALREAGRLWEADRELQQVLHDEPELARAHHQLGLVRLQAERRDLALESFRRAVELDAELVQARLYLVHLLATHPDDSIGTGDAALDVLAPLLDTQVEPRDAFVEAHAAALAAAGRYAEAREVVAAERRRLGADAPTWLADREALYATERRLVVE